MGLFYRSKIFLRPFVHYETSRLLLFFKVKNKHGDAAFSLYASDMHAFDFVHPFYQNMCNSVIR